ncbi:MAG: selenide, water dikinase SelD [Promethearchaeota archaeon]
MNLAQKVEDAAIIPIPNSELVLVKNIDILTPIVDEPEIMGQIAACNATNDVFAMNAPEVSGMLVFLAIQTNTPEEIAEGLLKGIKTFLETKINSKIVGGHTIYCEWPLIGGEASGFVHEKEIIPKNGVKLGDQLILTKPIGTQPVTAAYRLQKDFPEMLENYSLKELQNSIDLAITLMTTSNQGVVKVIHSYEDFSFIHAMTDVTGFGLAGHIWEMLQDSPFSAIINTIPSIKLTEELSHELGYAFDECLCHETAGGMIMAVDPSKAEEFSEKLTRKGVPNWNIGEIAKFKAGVVCVSEHAKNIEISSY